MTNELKDFKEDLITTLAIHDTLNGAMLTVTFLALWLLGL